MSTHRALTGKQFARILEKYGWELTVVKGSHHTYVKEGKRLQIPIHAKKTLKTGLLNALIKQAGVAKDEILRKDKKRKGR